MGRKFDNKINWHLREDVVRATESKPVVIDTASFIARHTKYGYSNIYHSNLKIRN